MKDLAGETVKEDSDQDYDSPVGSCDSPSPKVGNISPDKKKRSSQYDRSP